MEIGIREIRERRPSDGIAWNGGERGKNGGVRGKNGGERGKNGGERGKNVLPLKK